MGAGQEKMTTTPGYMADVARQMQIESESIRRSFASHHLSSGENREQIVKRFLKGYLPKRFGLSTGMIVSCDGEFSNQADLLVVDAQNNAPFHPTRYNKIWPVEAVYALIEVKTRLDPCEISDAIRKGRKFKKLRRDFCEPGESPRIRDSLFVIWAFESASTSTVRDNLANALKDVPRDEQPDFILVMDKFVGMSGNYLEISQIGQPNSQRRRELLGEHGSIPDSLPIIKVGEYGLESLTRWYIWLDSWLRQAGSRYSDPVKYGRFLLRPTRTEPPIARSVES